MSDDLSIPPSKDVKFYGELIKWMATRLGIPSPEPQTPVGDVVFGIVQRDLSAVMSLLWTAVFLQAVKTTLECPSPAPIFSKSLGHMHRIQESSVDFLYVHPRQNSLVVSASAKSEKQQPTPPDGEDKHLSSLASASPLWVS